MVDGNDGALLERLHGLAEVRGPVSARVAARVVKVAGGDATALPAVVAILDAVDPVGDTALWPTLSAVLKAGTIAALAAAVAGARAPRKPKAMLAIVTRLESGAAVLKAWQALA